MASLPGMMPKTSCGTLVILITSSGEFSFIILFGILHSVFFLVSFHCKKKKKKVAAGLFLCCFVLPCFYCRNFQWIRNPEGRLLKVNLPQEPRMNLN